MVTIRAGLCAGRHELPVAEYVFEKPLDPTDFAAMRVQAHLFVRERFGYVEKLQAELEKAKHLFVRDRVGYRICRDYAPNQRGVWGDAETRGRFGLGRLVLYVTGLSAALAAVIDACVCYGVPLTLMHYDRSADVYVAQELCTGGEMQGAGIYGAD